MNELLIWAGILFCVSQSAIFSGLNLAFFSLTRLRLEIAVEEDLSNRARRVLAMREDSNFLLTTILWGNVGINVLLTLLSDSVLTGVASFAFSTVIITFFGEIIPQAYFSRNALRMASALTPVLKIYQFLLYPVAKPCAMLLDGWLGKESVHFFTEENIKLFLNKHIEDDASEIDEIEGIGAINFLTLDDHTILEEGELILPSSVISLPTKEGKIVFPNYHEDDDDFIKKVNFSGEKWIILTNENDEPKYVLDADGFVRTTLYTKAYVSIEKYCYRPKIYDDDTTNLGEVLRDIKRTVEQHSDSPITQDVVLYWGEDERRIITGADLFGRLLKNI